MNTSDCDLQQIILLPPCPAQPWPDKMKILILLFIAILLSSAISPTLAQTASTTSEHILQGKLTEGIFKTSKLFPGTQRKYSVYVPSQYDPAKPAALMVFMDGSNFAKANGNFRVPAVFEELISQDAMPVTIAVFVDPGTVVATLPDATDRSNRSFEYDSLGDRYTNFLLDEFLPVAIKDLNVSTDPAQRAVCGSSSGGICAFTVAWQRPDQFGKVLSTIGSYTNIRGGWVYPGLIRKSKANPKPIEVYLQDGRDDLSNLFGDWPLANQDMAAALQYAGYKNKFVMTDGGHSGKWAGEIFPDALRWLWSEDKSMQPAADLQTKPDWKPHPDAVVKDNVPHGKVEAMEPLVSNIFDNTIRNWSIYVPAQYDKAKPAALMVFQDGGGFQKVDGRWRVPVVFDNLIASGEMPPTIAVFINPGHDQSKPRGPKTKPSNRGLEYDSLGDRYSRFLIQEITPEVTKRYNISTDPKMRAIGGSSSGGICAFTAAWERADQFAKVYTSVGSFVNLRGGNIYPSLIRKTEPKPIRIFMSDSSGDLDNPFGNWPLANRMMQSSLQYMGYDSKLNYVEGYGHNAEFGGSQFPEAMKWLWRADETQPQLDTSGDLKGDLTLLNLLVANEDWQIAAEELGFTDALCTDAEGNCYFCDMKASAIYRIDAAGGKPVEIAKESVSGLRVASDGMLFGCRGSKQQVISIDPKSGAVKVVAEQISPNDLVIAKNGQLFITETKSKQVTRINVESGETSVAATGIAMPNGIALSNDGGTLAVSEYGGDKVWTFRINADGVLNAKMPTMTLRSPIDYKGEFKFNSPPPYKASAKGDGMAVDKAGRYYVTSELGIQIFDPTGRLCGVLPRPDADQGINSCTLAGKELEILYVANGSKIYARRLNIEK